MKRRFFGIILVMVMIFSMTAMSFAGVQVSSQATVNTEDGSYVLAANATSSDGTPITYQWYECDEQGGGTITVDGATQAQYTPVRFNGVKYFICAATANNASGTAETTFSNVIKVEDNCEDGKDVEVFNFIADEINVPVAGEVPDVEAVSDQAGYTIESINWLPETDKFKPETVYTVTVNVKLDDNAKAGSGFACFINGKEAVISGDYTTGEFSFNYTFQATGKYADGQEADADREDMNFVEKIMDDLNIDVADIPTPFGIPYWAWGILILLIIISIFFVIASKRRAKKERMMEEEPNHLADIYRTKMEERGVTDIIEDDYFDNDKKAKAEKPAEEDSENADEEAADEAVDSEENEACEAEENNDEASEEAPEEPENENEDEGSDD